MKKALLIIPIALFLFAIGVKALSLHVSGEDKVYIRLQNNTGMDIENVWLGNNPYTEHFKNIGNNETTEYVKLVNEFPRYSRIYVITPDGTRFTYFMTSDPVFYKNTPEIDNPLEPGYYTFSLSLTGSETYGELGSSVTIKKDKIE